MGWPLDLTHWGRVTHIGISKFSIIGSDNGLSPGQHQAIIATNAEILLIEPLGTIFNEILIKLHTFSFKKIYFKLSPGKWQPFCLGLNLLMWPAIIGMLKLLWNILDCDGVLQYTHTYDSKCTHIYSYTSWLQMWFSRLGQTYLIIFRKRLWKIHHWSNITVEMNSVNMKSR